MRSWVNLRFGDGSLEGMAYSRSGALPSLKRHLEAAFGSRGAPTARMRRWLQFAADPRVRLARLNGEPPYLRGAVLGRVTLLQG